jgi:2-polyprenyl-6-methoxyphenol hydroxylase-like FAD-dependent oxidoreductase
MIRSEYDIIIAGGGASGLMLAASIDLQDRAGAVLEKTASLGTKLLMSGGGRCNITHGGSVKDFISAYGEAGPRLRKCLYRHSNAGLTEFLAGLGFDVSIEADGRAFPVRRDAGRQAESGETGGAAPRGARDLRDALARRAVKSARTSAISPGSAITKLRICVCDCGTKM